MQVKLEVCIDYSVDFPDRRERIQDTYTSYVELPRPPQPGINIKHKDFTLNTTNNGYDNSSNITYNADIGEYTVTHRISSMYVYDNKHYAPMPESWGLPKRRIVYSEKTPPKKSFWRFLFA